MQELWSIFIQLRVGEPNTCRFAVIMVNRTVLNKINCRIAVMD